MKKAVILLLCTALTISAVAQIQQRLEQIAKYAVYLDLLKKGYKIVQDGLNLINDIKHGDFNLFKDYFSSLDNVNPTIKSDLKVAAMYTMQQSIENGVTSYMREFRTGGHFTPVELTYLQNVFQTLQTDVGKTIDQVDKITSDGAYRMQDAQRIGQIDHLYTEMARMYTFVFSFGDQVKTLGLQRGQEDEDTQHLLQLY